jgi:hypothetical protein
VINGEQRAACWHLLRKAARVTSTNNNKSSQQQQQPAPLRNSTSVIK